MKLSTGILYHTLSARTSRLTAELRPPDPVRLLLCWAILGVGTGALLSHLAPALAESACFRQGLAVSSEPRSLWQVCCGALCPMLLLLTGIWMSGCAAFGQIPALLLLFSRGMAFGAASAACMENRTLRDGLCITAVLILPYGFCSILLLCGAGGILLESLRYDHFLEFSFVRLEQVAYGLILVFGVARAIRSRKRGPAWPAIALTAAAIGVSAGVEFALDRTSISHPLLYAVMIAALALPVGMALRGITGKGTERA